MNTVRVERRWIREGVGRPRVEVRGPIVAFASLCAVFALSFAVGHVTSAGKTARVEAAPTLPIASVSAAVPVGLTSALPLDAARIAPVVRAAVPARSEAFRASIGPSQTAPAVSATPAQEQPAAPTSSAPQRATAVPSPETHSSPARPAPAAAPASSGGGFFDTSG